MKYSIHQKDESIINLLITNSIATEYKKQTLTEL